MLEAPGGSAPAAKGTSLHWGAAAFGLAVHSVAGGVALASAAAAGAARTHGLGNARLGRRRGGVGGVPGHGRAQAGRRLDDRQPDAPGRRPRPRAHLVNLGFALMIPLGVALFFLSIGRLGPEAAVDWAAGALAFSGGTFLCIALSDLLPELQFHAHDRTKLSLALLAGFVLMLLTAPGGARRIGTAGGESRGGPRG